MEDDISRNSINPGERGSYITANETSPLQRDKVHDEGFRYIITTFAVVTIILTIALGVTISQEIREVGFSTDVISDRVVCTNVGREIFKTGGNAVDAAIAVNICLGVVLPHLTGLGGNGLIMVYNQKLSQPSLCLDSWTPGNLVLPKLLLALYKTHEKYGRKPWEKIIDPSVKLAREGFSIAESLIQSKVHLKQGASPGLVNWLASLKVGTTAAFPRLADTLATIQKEGPDALYKGSLSLDLKDYYGEKLMSDLNLNENPCQKSTVDGYHLVSSGRGSGGPLLHEAILQANITHESTLTNLINYLTEKEETSWPFPSGVVVSASDDQDIYVSIVSGLGPVLGAQNLSVNGYIFGASPGLPSTRHLASIGTAFVASDSSSLCKKRLITGGVDVRDLLQVVPGLLWGDADLQTAVEGPRARFSMDGLLQETDHAPSFSFPSPPAPKPYPTVNVIHKFSDTISSYADSRSGL